MAGVPALVPALRGEPVDDGEPIRSAPPGPSPNEVPEETRDGPPESPPPGRRILICDDHRDSAKSLSMVLTLVGYRVKTAHSGPDGLAAAHEWRPDVAILNIGLPGMDGYRLARRIRGEPWGKDILLMALTGWAGEAHERRARDAGFDHYLVKPASMDELVDLIRGAEG